MKKLYMPTEEDIYQLIKLQNVYRDVYYVGINIYEYLTAKVIEKLINEDYDIEEIEKLFANHIGIIYGLCHVCPEKMENTSSFKNFPGVCRHLINQTSGSRIYNLDNLGKFSKEVQFSESAGIIDDVIKILYEELENHPEYRFNYKDSFLLNSIFSVDFEQFSNLSIDCLKKLCAIDPIYSIKFNSEILMPAIYALIEKPEERTINYQRSQIFKEGVRKYLRFYGFYNLDSSPIIVNEEGLKDEKTKKLVKLLQN